MVKISTKRANIFISKKIYYKYLKTMNSSFHNYLFLNYNEKL